MQVGGVPPNSTPVSVGAENVLFSAPLMHEQVCLSLVGRSRRGLTFCKATLRALITGHDEGIRGFPIRFARVTLQHSVPTLADQARTNQLDASKQGSSPLMKASGYLSGNA